MGKLNTAITAFLNKFGGKAPKPRVTTAVIVAGGSSTRMGEGLSKQWLTVGGLPVIARTLLAFERAKTITDIVLVVKADEIDRYRHIAEQYGLKKPLRIVTGGDTRQQSAKKGFLACADKADFVAIHDGARCLVTPEEIDRVCSTAYLTGAAIAATRVHDTVKLATDNGYIEKTVDRDKVWLAQTPQVFKTALYHAATAVAEKDGISVTDDSSLAEHIEHPVRLVECSQQNLKLTTPEDILRAEAILSDRERKEADA